MANRHAQNNLPNFGWQKVRGPHHIMAYRTSRKAAAAVSMAVIAVLVFVGTFAAATWADVSGAVSSQKVQVIQQKGAKKVDDSPVDPYANKVINILLIGQDTRDGAGNAVIGGSGSDVENLHNSDTTMILQIAADRKSMNLVSIPRDLMVSTPGCQTTNGEIAAQSSVMFNSIFANGYSQGGDVASAASCTLNEVNHLSGLDIQNFMVVDFGGLVNMINAIGGVDICIPTQMTDVYTGLNLSPGMQHLTGGLATQYARMRHGTGTDGSDTMRTTRQQYLIRQLVKTALSKNYFTQTSELYQLAKSALDSVQMSEGLANVGTLAGLATSLKNFSMDNLYSMTIPITPWVEDPNRSQLADGADAVWEKLRKGQPLVDKAETAATVDGTTTTDGTTADGATADGTTADGTVTDSSTYNEKIGVITQADGTLIDAQTGGIIDPETGAIRSSVTGQFIGMNNRYIEVTYCGVTY